MNKFARIFTFGALAVALLLAAPAARAAGPALMQEQYIYHCDFDTAISAAARSYMLVPIARNQYPSLDHWCHNQVFKPQWRFTADSTLSGAGKITANKFRADRIKIHVYLDSVKVSLYQRGNNADTLNSSFIVNKDEELPFDSKVDSVLVRSLAGSEAVRVRIIFLGNYR